MGSKSLRPGVMKRKAEAPLDRDEILQDDDEQTHGNKNAQRSTDNMATPEQIAARRIVKLKVPGQIGEPQQGEGKEATAAKFELAGSLGGEHKNGGSHHNEQTGGQAPSFLNKIITPNQGAQNQTGSEGTAQSQPQPSLFSNLLKKSAQEDLGMKIQEEKKEPEKKGLFADLFSKKDDSKPSPLFSSGNGLFGQTPSTGGGLFSGIFGGSNNSLANLANKDYSYVHKESGEKPEEKEKEAAKSAEERKPTLFASLGEYKPFSGENKPSLFSGTNTNSTLFGPNSTLFSNIKDEDDEGEEGDDEPQRSPSPEADVTKSKGSYQYQYDYEKIASKKVTKFKPGTKTMLLEGEVAINKTKEGTTYFLTYRNKAKLVQFQGQLVPKASTIEYLNPRQDAISITTYSVDKTAATETEGEGEAAKPNKPKLVKEAVKAMFASADDCNDFKKELEKVLS